MQYIDTLKLRIGLFSLFLFLQTLVLAQGLRNYYSLNVDDGLSQNSVWDVWQDYKGYLWISTSDGINRFDGYNFKHYQSKVNSPNSIAGIGIFKFYEDQQNKLWVAHDRGISYYNRALDNFENIYKYQPIAKGTTINNFIAEDTNGLWALISSVGIIHIDKKSSSVDKTIPIAELKNSPYYFHHKETIKEHHFIQLTYDYILHFNSNTYKYSLIKLENNNTRCFNVLNDSTLFYIDGYNRVDYNFYSKEIKRTKLNSTLKLNNVEYIDCIKYNGKYYFAGVFGIYLYDIFTNTVSENKLSDNKNAEADYTYVQSLRIDRNNLLWICGNGGGLKLFSPFQNKFKSFNTPDIRKNMVKSICAIPNGPVFTGIFDNGMVQYDSVGNYSIPNFYIDPNPTFASVYAINQWSSNKIVYIKGHSICVYDFLKKNMVFRKEIENNIFAFPSIIKVGSVYNFNSNTVLFNIDSNYILNEIAKFSDKTITCFSPIKNTFWIGTISDLFIYNTLTGRSRIINKNNHIKSICVSSSSNVYVGTTNGLLVFNNAGKLMNTLNTENLLKSNFIYGVLEDENKCIWLSHNNGLSKYNPNNNSIVHFDKSDGLQSNEFNTGAYSKGTDGRLYFGGINGFNIVDVNSIPVNTSIINIGLNKINLFDEPFKTDSSYNEIQQLNLLYTQNTLSFDFSALDFSNPGKNEYKYQLEGWDPAWISSGTRHFARYANLPHGVYTLKIIASNSDGVWSANVKTIKIIITPPFWLTTWFFIMEGFLVVLFFSSILYYFSYRQRRKLKQKLQIQKQLEDERIRISRDLHDNVGAQLSYLITNMEWMAEHTDEISKYEEVKRLNALTESGREAIQTLRHTIWAISQHELTIDDFADRFKQYTLKILEFNKSIAVNFKEDFKGTQLLSPAVALNLFRICQEALSNCIKHAQCTRIDVLFKSAEEQVFEFELVDNGIGFDNTQSKLTGHYGLLNMEARAKECNAIFTIISAPDKGTTVKLMYNKQ